MTFYIGLN